MKRFATLLLGLSAVLVQAGQVMACAVCGGNPDSELVKGAESGVITLVLITYALLMGFAGMIAFWTVRARRIKGPPK